MLICFVLMLASASSAQEESRDFSAWLEQLREDARSAGITEKTLDVALANLEAPEPEVIERDQQQPEKTITLTDYVSARVTPERIAEGRLMLRRYRTWLGRVEKGSTAYNGALSSPCGGSRAPMVDMPELIL